MASQLGIKQLLDAEAKAQEIISKARKDKVNLLKQAHEEADKEIRDYRAARQKDFEQFEKTSYCMSNTQHLSGTEGYKNELAVQTQVQTKQVQEQLEKKSPAVIEKLLGYVSTVRLE